MANPVAAILARPNDDTTKTVVIAALVAFVCAVLVSTASVLLDPIQQEQIEAEQAARMEAMLDTLPGMREVMEEAGVTALETRIVDLTTGAFAPEIDPASFDMMAAANDPAQSIELSTEEDLASIRRRPNHAPVHLLERDGNILLIVLPVYGSGYRIDHQSHAGAGGRPINCRDPHDHRARRNPRPWRTDHRARLASPVAGQRTAQ